MIMADVFTVLFLIVGSWLALPALCLVLRGAAPGLVERARGHCEQTPGRALLVGLGTVLLSLLAVAVLAKLPGAAKPVAALLAAALVVFCFAGVAGAATHLGERLGSPRDEQRPWLATVRGMVCLELASSLPIVGWFLLFPLLLLLGAGAAVLAMASGHRAAREPTGPVATIPAAPAPLPGAAAVGLEPAERSG